LRLTGETSGSGTISVKSGATVQAIGNIGADFAFTAGTAETLFVQHGSVVTGTIMDYGDGATIDLRLAVSKVSFADGTLLLEAGKNHTTVGTLHVAGNYTDANFKLTSDGHGGTYISFADVAQSSELAFSKTVAEPRAWLALLPQEAAAPSPLINSLHI
jgi:hypothetical protein